ncbi:F-box protein CPR1-like [Cornus florida]|uniref:F-box protein CPR1-like n=1 Tax=Cornus florida TaxID=4283 RepID=UPI0028A2C3F7|nr:F-box protein CPR1-like [Cornus florida]
MATASSEGGRLGRDEERRPASKENLGGDITPNIMAVNCGSGLWRPKRIRAAVHCSLGEIVNEPKKDKEGRGEAMKIERRDEYLPKNLPHDLVVDILSRLPVKSLVRFKSVSKSWLTLFTDPRFVKMHLNRSQKRMKIVFPSDYSSRLVVFSTHNIDDLTEMHVDSVLQFPSTTAEPWVTFIGSCDGLLLCLTSEPLCNLFEPSKKLYLFNLSTREFNRLPDSLLINRLYISLLSYGFGYDSCTDDYKIVEISRPSYGGSSVAIYTLKTNVWRWIQDIPDVVMHRKHATLLNGSLHWLTKYTNKILYLNLADEKFQYFLLPEFDFHITDAAFLSVLRKCLGICVPIIDIPASMVMMEYGKRESWTSLGLNFPTRDVKPLNYSNEDEILFVLNDHWLGVCNPQKSTQRYVQIPSDTRFRSLQLNYAETFLETIVSTSHRS